MHMTCTCAVCEATAVLPMEMQSGAGTNVASSCGSLGGSGCGLGAGDTPSKGATSSEFTTEQVYSSGLLMCTHTTKTRSQKDVSV